MKIQPKATEYANGSIGYTTEIIDTEIKTTEFDTFTNQQFRLNHELKNEVILGMDFIRDNQVDILFSLDKIQINGKVKSLAVGTTPDKELLDKSKIYSIKESDILKDIQIFWIYVNKIIHL
ncbi:hypothetical protein A0H76_650 [Hepatospora eriocheir]|uniref:Uncharacterized protein n=1 Tax=Hepatospora eriocheir TaxID=1081669 RepID=A0A1X0QII1_9MICR|nr:hypothetical protein A0H76_650 [Hepatospora eriocheir]